METETGQQLKREPERWLADEKVRLETVESLLSIAHEAVGSVNDYIGSRLDEDDEFDPKVTFKSRSGVSGVKVFMLRIARTLHRKKIGFYFAVSPSAQ